MALLQCSECGKQISDKASACPNCGNPVVQESSQIKITHKQEGSFEKGFGETLGSQVADGIGGCLRIIVAVIIVLFILFVILVGILGQKT